MACLPRWVYQKQVATTRRRRANLRRRDARPRKAPHCRALLQIGAVRRDDRACAPVWQQMDCGMQTIRSDWRHTFRVFTFWFLRPPRVLCAFSSWSVSTASHFVFCFRPSFILFHGCFVALQWCIFCYSATKRTRQAIQQSALSISSACSLVCFPPLLSALLCRLPRTSLC